MPAQNVTLTQHIQQSLQNVFTTQSFSQVGVLVDENTRRDCYPLIKDVLPAHTLCEIKSGETHKHLHTCEQIWLWLTRESFDRKALLINLGGGVIGDMGGFCAATFKRGIRFINVPTTLLSQVDASVGGKLGIDFHGFKNHIGLFEEPMQVIIDAVFLKTLPARELRSGFAEIIKHSLIADAAYWPQIAERTLEQQPWAMHINHSVQIKAAVVDQDFKEGGLRKILNFGHTVGHAVESFFLETDTPLLHGEAIAVGMICEAYLSQQYSNMPAEEVEAIERYIHRVFGYTPIREEDMAPIAALAMQDKKNESNTILCSLLQRIGQARYDVAVSAADIEKALLTYKKRLA